MNPLKENVPPGLQVFDRLQAEFEKDWLDAVFVAPAVMEYVNGMRSCVIYGGRGMGKTMLALQLERQANRIPNVPPVLVVNWRPSLPHEPLAGSAALRFYFAQICDQCARTLLEWIAEMPERLTSLAEHTFNALACFIQTFSKMNLDAFRQTTRTRYSDASYTAISHLLSYPSTPLYAPEATESYILNQLTLLVEEMGLRGVWLISDRLEPWLDGTPQEITENLISLFAALALFEDDGFSWKFFAPASLVSSLEQVGAIRRRRIQPYRLEWQQAELIAIVERRLAVAFGKTVSLSDIYKPPSKTEKAKPDAQKKRTSEKVQIISKQRSLHIDLSTYLAQFAGTSPHTWLDMLRPFVKMYLNIGMARPLTQDEFEDAKRQAAPPLAYDLENDQVYLGEHPIDNLTKGQRKLLRYLYEHRHKVCSKLELYYLAHLGYSKMPLSHVEKEWEPLKNVENVVDNHLMRLRQAIEPQPSNPLYITTIRQMGIQLKHYAEFANFREFLNNR